MKETSSKPKISVKPGIKYDASLSGHYGKLGEGRYGVRFIQTAVDVRELDKLKLITQLPASEKWPIRNLFQRDINHERVHEEIIPYFLNSNTIKFFNPLTIVLLPTDSNTHLLQLPDRT